MKPIIFKSACLVLTLFVTELQSKTRVTIQDAISKKLIKADATCTGGLNLKLDIANLSNDSVSITIPPGWQFVSNDSQTDVQDILIVKTIIFELRAKEKKQFKVGGFCCEYTKGGPYSGIKYTLGKTATKNLVTLASFLSKNTFEQGTMQSSVWAVSDNKPTAAVSSANDSVAAILRNFVANIKGEPLPWYTVTKHVFVSQMGTVYDSPKKFKANVNYSITKTCYSYCYIIDKKGNKISETKGRWLQPEDTKYDADIDIKGFEKGEYELIIENNEESIFRKSFNI